MRPLRDSTHARAEFARAEPQKKGSLVDIFFMKSPLHGHAKKGNVGEITRLCTVRREALSEADYQAYVNGCDNINRQTPLLCAAQGGHEAAVRELVRQGGRLEARDVNGRDAYLYCGRYGHVQLLRALEEMDETVARETSTDGQGDSILHLAATHGHAQVIQHLVEERHFDVNRPNRFGETPLHKAARTDRSDTVHQLLSLGADREIMGRHGKPRHVASSNSVKLLLKDTRERPVPPPRKKTPTPDDSATCPPAALPHPQDKAEIEEEQRQKPDKKEPQSGKVDDGIDENAIALGDYANLERKLGASPSTEVVRFHLMRAVRKTSQFLGGELLTSPQAERPRRSASPAQQASSASPPSVCSFLAEPNSQGEVVIEPRLGPGKAATPAPLPYLFEPYRAMFSDRHYHFVCRDFETPSGSHHTTVIMTMRAKPADDGSILGLLRSRAGYLNCRFSASEYEEIKKEHPTATQANLFRQLLDCYCMSVDDVFTPMNLSAAGLLVQARDAFAELEAAEDADSNQPHAAEHKSSIIKSLRDSIMSNSHSQHCWTHLDDASLSIDLLAMEVKLGLPRTLTVGVLVACPGQDEASAMNNSMSSELERFLSIIASPIDTQGWSGYAGGLTTKEHVQAFYTNWAGLEIVFHCAAYLTPAMQRQFVGNDKTLIYFLDKFRPQDAWKPTFRGHVNSFGLVVTRNESDAYQLACYHREGMSNTRPMLPSDPISAKQGLRDVVLSKIVSAHVDAYHFLYGVRMRRAWEDEINALAEKYAGKKRKARRETRRQ